MSRLFYFLNAPAANFPLWLKLEKNEITFHDLTKIKDFWLFSVII